MEHNTTKPPTPQSIRLCLSGGGLRATFFHLGVVRALKRLNLLNKVTDIVSVSGGSIIAAHLVLNWKQYVSEESEQFDGAQSNLLSLRAWDLRGNVIRRSVLWWPFYFLALRFPRYLSRFRIGRTELLRQQYDRYFGGLTLDDLRTSSTGSPQLHLVTANLVTGGLCSFTKEHYVVVEKKPMAAPGAEEKKLTAYPAELTKLSMAVAASSAFPPVFPPILFDESMTGVKPGAFHTSPHVLTDGGVYDNTGYESATLIEANQATTSGKVTDLIIVSDAGSPFQWQLNSEFRDPLSLALRASEIIANRVAEETLKRIVSQDRIALLSIDEIDEGASLAPMVQRLVSEIRTDLDRFSDVEAAALVTHGEDKAARTLLQKYQITASAPMNDLTIRLPKSSEIADALGESWRVKWWNSFTNFTDWRTSVIYLIGQLILSAPVVAFSSFLKSLEAKSAAQAAANQRTDFENTLNALQASKDAVIARRQARISELQNEVGALQNQQQQQAQPQRQACRHPSHGPPERFAVDQTVTIDSEWRPGGYNQAAWCGDVETQLRAKFTDPIFERKGSNEVTRDACAPFRCIQYKYTCTIHVLANPV
jgi:predicted acylesterase/phospholipase RssA